MKYRIMFLTILIIVSIIIYFVLSNNECKKKILKQVFNDDKTAIAILVQENCGGATIGFRHKLYLSSSKDDFYEKEILNASKVNNNISVSWANNNLLEVKISSPRIYKFTNFWWDNKNKREYIIKLLD